MAYSKAIIHGETEDRLDGDRYLKVQTGGGEIVLHAEDAEGDVDVPISVVEALALIRALTEAIEDVS